MTSLVSIAGIDQAIANLALNPETQKAKLLTAIRSWFSGPEDLQTVTEIAVDALVTALWDDDPASLKARRKSLSSLKSALNKNFKDLSAQGLNPEGLILGRSNTFEVSEEQKKALLEKLGVGGGDSHLAETIAALKKAYPERIEGPGDDGLSGLFHELEQARDRIAQLQDALREKEGEISTLQKEISAFGSTSSSGTPGWGPGLEQRVQDGAKAGSTGVAGESSGLEAAIQEIGEGEFEEIAIDDTDSLADAHGAGDLEAGGLGGNESDFSTAIQEVDEGEFEEVEIDDTDILADAPGAGDLEAGGLGDSEPDFAAAIQEIGEGEFEEIAIDDTDGLADAPGAGDLEAGGLGDSEPDFAAAIQEVGEGEFEEIAIDDTDILADAPGAGDLEAEGLGDSEPDLATAIQEVDEGEFEEIAIADTDILADAHGAGDLEAGGLGDSEPDFAAAIQEIGEGEFEEIAIDDTDGLADAPGAGDLEAGGLGDSEPDFAAAIQEVDEGEFEEIAIDDTDILADAPGASDLEAGGLGGSEPDLAAAIQEIDEGEFEEIAIDDTDILADAPGAGDLEAGGLGGSESDFAAAIQEIDEGEFEEVELAAGDNAVRGGVPAAGDDADAHPQSKLLEVLSKYLEPEEAIQGSAAILIESEEGLVAQLLERFTPKFIKIPTGSYSFGCPEPSAQEHPWQMARATEFYLGQYPVTNDLFELFVRETGYETDAEKGGYGLVHEGQWRSSKDPNTGLASFAISQVTSAHQVNGANWRHPTGPGCLLEHRHNHPVVQVSHRDAQAFAAWAGKRLPTEVEWEAAARGPDGLPFPWGETWDPGRGNFSSSCLGETTPVERYFDKGRSAFGIGDLLGNVYEWTASSQQALTTRHFILKGGCWHSRGIISACHRQVALDTWSNTIGFRLAVSG